MYSWIMLLASGGGGLEGHHGHESVLLSPETGLTFWAMLTFGVAILVLKKVGWGPLYSALEERETRITKALSAVEDAKAEAARIAEEQNQAMELRRQEAEKVIEEARKDAEGIVAKAQADATKAAEETKARALKEIELARAKAVDDLRKETVELALQLSEKIIKAEVQQGRHKDLIDDVISSWENN